MPETRKSFNGLVIKPLGSVELIRKFFPERSIYFFENDWIVKPNTMAAVAERVCLKEYQGLFDPHFTNAGTSLN